MVAKFEHVKGEMRQPVSLMGMGCIEPIVVMTEYG
ncbi:hypothetical protein AFERRID_25330 [Acidithiobacillus ferridurans]|jgi:hypothetical protein|uniref:Uncharacterized protein n=1 Tax=Acidithiobacillus ferridurans TaxID=1232575 RepID=A0A2Z6INN5_ACIFI|nr:hypothetical protein AFERRID_15610 [Acidithiobacillus ferridurans]BBF66315.1 hypothetical protein AFERRID_25330 [Acidithiobacillus ferridurans]